MASYSHTGSTADSPSGSYFINLCSAFDNYLIIIIIIKIIITENVSHFCLLCWVSESLDAVEAMSEE